ncbi:hypothetical protein [uncultured Brevundimonas sp.]|uniref:hypothetical protein n=1 Tax=uncultured Brevundimonas sp. TaxID=213418 RepID=UPI0025FFA7C2|nr:hypothetical protein [uncultured Brevundimonas sp.]
MAAAIGLRFYKTSAHKRNSRDDEPTPASELLVPVATFLTGFVASHLEPKQNDERERSWYFEEGSSSGVNSITGYVHYGTFGFESQIKSGKTKQPAYDRQVDDVEEIPLFFDFWSPDAAEFSMLAFQSFQGRSCVSLVLEEMKLAFEAANPGQILRFQKLTGLDSPQSIYGKAPVKRLRLIKHKVSADKFSNYGSADSPSGIDFEVSFKARRGGHLGHLTDLASGLSKTKRGLVIFKGEEFDEAVATVLIGNRQRPVGIIGPNSDTGAIDITEHVKRGPNGHPLYASISAQSGEIAMDLYNRLVSP